MREVLTLSLPPQMTQEIKKRAKKRGYDSVSSYMINLLKMDEDVITADELLRLSKKADRDYKAGKLIKLKSLKDLAKL